jgi:hypothetical protein
MSAACTQSRSLLRQNYSTWGLLRMANMGKEDARRGRVSWLVEPLYGNRIHRLIQSTHHLRAEALAKTHRRYFIKLNDETSTTY